MERIDLIGQRFGELTVIERMGVTAHGNSRTALWRCQCSCSAEIITRADSLRRGAVRSCGHLSKMKPTKHGEARHNANKTPEYRTWGEIIQRCENPKRVNFKFYGGRGIKMCDEWRQSFPTFLAHVGRRPSPQHSIDRIDSNGNYEPGNVRWATVSEQIKNRRPRVKE